jgi:hypothetical protein
MANLFMSEQPTAPGQGAYSYDEEGAGNGSAVGGPLIALYVGVYVALSHWLCDVILRAGLRYQIFASA